jgi:hypothetical protein
VAGGERREVMAYHKESYICTLNEPAECKYRIDGKLSHVTLCGGNSLFDEIKRCGLRILVTVTEKIEMEGK